MQMELMFFFSIGLLLPSEESSWRFADGRTVTVRSTSYEVRSAAGEVLTQREVDPMLRLRRAAFDPLAGVPGRAFDVETGELHIVQFKTRVLPEYSEALEALGAEIHRFLPAQALVVSATPEEVAAIQALAFVRWTGAYHADYRIDPTLIAEIRADLAAGRGASRIATRSRSCGAARPTSCAPRARSRRSVAPSSS